MTDSVGENAGMKLDEEGGIEIYVAAEKPKGVPEENWLPNSMALMSRIRISLIVRHRTPF